MAGNLGGGGGGAGFAGSTLGAVQYPNSSQYSSVAIGATYATIATIPVDTYAVTYLDDYPKGNSISNWNVDVDATNFSGVTTKNVASGDSGSSVIQITDGTYTHTICATGSAILGQTWVNVLGFSIHQITKDKALFVIDLFYGTTVSRTESIKDFDLTKGATLRSYISKAGNNGYVKNKLDGTLRWVTK